MATMVRVGVFRRTGLAALVVTALLAAGSQVWAQESSDIDTRARALFRTIMSPYCPGSLLNECPSSQAAVLRDSVRARLARGMTEDEIRQGLLQVYGDEILAAPPMDGFGGLAWLGAIAAFIGGLALAGLWLQHRRKPPVDAPQPRQVDPEELERVRRELSAHEEG